MRAARTTGQQLASLPEAIPWAAWERVLDGALGSAGVPEDLVVLDCASGHAMTPLLLAARTSGTHVVLANKDPLTSSLAQYHALAGGDARRSLRMSATGGAGLPGVATLRALVASCDSLFDLGAQASGSLCFISAELSPVAPLDALVPLAA